MQPLFTYNVPQTSWYIIITDTSNHFYFNNNDKCSYWQLNDLKNHYNIDIDNFIKLINFDELSVIIAKSRGVKIESKQEEKEEENVPKINDFREEQEEDEEEEIIFDNVQVSSIPSPKPKKVENPQSILQGYSSSEEEDDEEEDEDDAGEDKESIVKDTIDIDEITAQAIAQHQSQQDTNQSSDDDDDDDDDNSLDLSLDEDQGTISKSGKQDFINLLNQFSNKISIYDTWDLIEEELIQEFIKFPEYLTISSKQEKEKIFQKWCSQQQQHQQSQEIIDDNDEIMITKEDTGIFPTPKLKFLNFLRDFKSEIKDSFYQSFYTENYEKINQFNLSSSIKELIFRNYKIMLNDFTKFAKNFKKQNKNLNKNIKVMKLDEYLNDKSIKGSYIIDENLSFFDNWIKLLNKNNISAEIAENEINFLVGDEKRLNSYIQQLN